LTAAGFARTEAVGIPIFLDVPGGKVRDAVHILFAAEKVHESDLQPNPDVAEAGTEVTGTFRTLNLEPLVRMKLTSFRLKDQVHVQDMLGVGLIDASWVARLPSELGTRLQQILDTPNG
jgi:hypothetical protein